MSFPVPSSSLLSAFVLATIGGLAVLGGLALEKFSDLLNDRFVGGYKPHKWLSEFGWVILMIGITIETGIAGKSAISEWKTTHKVDELGKQTDILNRLTQPQWERFDFGKFAKALDGKRKMGVQILYTPEDSGSYLFAGQFEMGFEIAGWKIIESPRPFNKSDIPPDWRDIKTVPLAAFVGAGAGGIGFAVGPNPKNTNAWGDVLSAIAKAEEPYPNFGLQGFQPFGIPTNVVRIVIPASP